MTGPALPWGIGPHLGSPEFRARGSGWPETPPATSQACAGRGGQRADIASTPKEIDLSSALMKVADGGSGAQLRFGDQGSFTLASSAEVRAHAAAAIQAQLGCAVVVVFEPPTTGAEYQRTYAAGEAAHGEGVGFMPGGTLARWLRVNEEPLVLASDAGVIKDLVLQEREQLRTLGASVCFPFVANDDLVAFATACGVESIARRDKTLAAFGAWAAKLAPRWPALRASEWAAARRTAIERSHQLGTTGELAASIAHEVRNPLAAIRSSVQLAQDEGLSAGERSEILRDALRDLDRIDRTATGLLQLSRPRATNLARVRLDHFVRDVVDFIRPYANGRGVTVVFESLAEPLSVRMDELDMWQAMINLLLNACQACEAGGHVTLRAGRAVATAGSVELSVEDTGSGIAPEHLARVFDAFFTTKPGGSGLGLPFCRQAIEQHGGAIRINSTPGAGTTVCVQLPSLEMDRDGLDSGR